MYQISVRQHFDAAHYLRGYKGKCEELHGHRFQVVAVVEAPELDDIGMALDFSELKKYLKEISERFDHICLNDIAPFDEVNPTSENIAATVYHQLQPRLKGKPVSIVEIEVWESPESCATYIP